MTNLTLRPNSANATPRWGWQPNHPNWTVTEPPQSRPAQVAIFVKDHPDYEFLRHILVDLTIGENKQHMVSEPRTAVYGIGKTVDAAVSDFMSMLIDTFDELEESEIDLAPGLLERLGILRSIVRRRNA